VPRRQSKKIKSLWNEYPDYTPINNVDEKPLFDETIVGDEHRVLGQIIRENWYLIHPLARDYMLSSASEWRKLLTETGLIQSNLETKQKSLAGFQDDFDKKTQRLLIEKNAEFERIKEETAESFKETIEQKDHEIANLKLLVDSVDETSISRSNLETDLSEKGRKISELESVIGELKDKCRQQEVEAMNIQTGISKNFQQQINNITKELYEKQEQIDKLREILNKAKEQLIILKGRSESSSDSKDELESKVIALERLLEERDEKLRKVVKTIESLE
jgi:chromosome segregation ATPase